MPEAFRRTRTRTRTRAALAAVAAVAGLVLAGCGDSGSGSRQATPSAGEDFSCLTPAQARSGSITYDDTEGHAVGAYLAGRGTTGVVLAHQRNGNVCQWIPKAVELAGDGYRVLAVNSGGHEVPEIVAGAKLLRDKGARRVLLMGASKGGTAVLEAAPQVKPQVNAVVSLSAPEKSDDVDATGAVSEIAVPVLYMAARDDTQYADSTRALHAATTKAPENELVVVGGGDHGVSMLDDSANWAKVTAFLKKYGG